MVAKKRRDIAKELGIRPPGVAGDLMWWSVPKEEQATSPYLPQWIDLLRQRQATRYDNFRRLLSLYEWGYRYSITDTAFAGECPIDEAHLVHNAAQNIIDTVAAKITKNEIVPMPLTVGGDMENREQAKRLGNALAGEFQENKIGDLHEDVVLDGLVQGAAFAEVYREAGRVCVRKVPAEEMVAEESDVLYRSPRTLGRKMRMDRYQALALFADPDDDGDDLVGTWEERARAILSVKPADLKGQAGHSGHNGQIDIYQGWHLPSSKPVKGEDGEWLPNDGRKQIAIVGCLLSDGPHNSDRFPIVKWCPRPRRRSYWGLSLMHALASGEREYEKLTLKVQKAHQKMGGTHILARKQNITTGELDNDQGTILYVEDVNQVKEWNPQPVNPETYQYMNDIPNRMQNTVGVSQMSTQSQIPSGLAQASGKALQVFDDFEAERLLPYHKESERWHIEIGQLMIDEIRAILAESDEPYMAKYKHQEWIDEIDWREVLNDESEYRLVIEAANNLASKPAAKYEQLSEMLQDGAMDISEFRRQMGLPDPQGAMDLASSDEDIIMQNLRKMAVDLVYHEPQPFDDLQLYLKLAGRFYNLARLKGCKPQGLQYIMDAIEQVKRLLSLETQQQPQPVPNGPPAPVVGAPAPMQALGQPPPVAVPS